MPNFAHSTTGQCTYLHIDSTLHVPSHRQYTTRTFTQTVHRTYLHTNSTLHVPSHRQYTARTFTQTYTARTFTLFV
jgi:hypothetical protein